MTPERLKYATQVAKLRRMADGSPHKGEARSFAAAAKRIQKKHRITEDEIATCALERIELLPIGADLWKKYLAEMCCKANHIALMNNRTHLFAVGSGGRAWTSARMLEDWRGIIENIACIVGGKVWRTAFHDALCLGIVYGMDAAHEMEIEAEQRRATKPTEHARSQPPAQQVPDDPPGPQEPSPTSGVGPNPPPDSAFEQEVASLARTMQNYDEVAMSLGRSIGFSMRFGTLRLLESSKCHPPSRSAPSFVYSTPGAPPSRLLTQSSDGSYVPISSRPSSSMGGSTFSGW